jgi:hypothetical protein
MESTWRCALLVIAGIAACESQAPTSLAEQHQQIQTQVFGFLLDSTTSHGRVRVFCLGAVANDENVDPDPTIIRALGSRSAILVQASRCKDQIPRQLNAHNDSLALLSLWYRLDPESTSLDVRAMDIQGPLWASHFDCQLVRRGGWKLKGCRLAAIS